jgi:hypothetical protein
MFFMKKHIFSKLLLFAFLSLAVVSCSDDTSINDDASSHIAAQARGTGDFKSLLGKLYGTTYTFGVITTLKNNGVTYTVTEVNRTGLTKPQGYILETPDADYYYEHNPDYKLLNEYVLGNDKPNVYDLSSDPNYTGEFTPTPSSEPEDEPEDPFWGYGPWHNGPCVDGKMNRSRAYHVFWLSVKLEVEPNIPC